MTTKSRIEQPFTSKPFGLPSDDGASQPFQTVSLTTFEGASIMLDLRARGSPQHPTFQCRLRIAEIQQDIPVTAKHDITVPVDDSSRKMLEYLTIPEIKARLTENGDAEAMRGKTKKSDLLAELRSSEERRHPLPMRIVARKGQTGVVTKPLYVDSQGEHRIAVSFNEGECTRVFPSSVELGDPVPSTGETAIGEGSTYRVCGGSIKFSKFRGGEQEYFVYSSPVPAAPGVLVPWREAFNVERQQPQFFKTTEAVSCQIHARLEMEFVYKGMRLRSEPREFDTPEPKRRRLTM